MTALLSLFMLGSSTPHVDIFENVSNVFGRALPHANSTLVKYLGNFTTFNDCQAACLAYAPSVDSPNHAFPCQSFSYHHSDFPQASFAGACYSVIDHSWIPVPNSALITSGRVNWPPLPCGASDPCNWQIDPVPLEDNLASIISEGTFSVEEAKSFCLDLPDCVAFDFQDQSDVYRDSSLKYTVTFRNDTATTHNGLPAGFVTFRKAYSLENDPYRTLFHFQPPNNWMNDPNGPLVWKGQYHLFYQWNPLSNVGFSDMHWGHAVSKDLLSWKQLPVALSPDSGSCGGEWSGSATLGVPGEVGPVLSYAVQCNSWFGQAYAADLEDEDLKVWLAKGAVGGKAPGTGGFRDPSRGFQTESGIWNQLLACNGAACLYESQDFKKWSYAGHFFGSGKGPTWEMPDVFPLNHSLFFFKVGMENGTDYYSLGTISNKSFHPSPGVSGIPDNAQRCDFGNFYSSKSFTGANKPILIGWIGEEGGPLKEWSGIQSIPRIVTLDNSGIALFNPIDVSSFRDKRSKLYHGSETIMPSSQISLNISGRHLDIDAYFYAANNGGSWTLTVLDNMKLKVEIFSNRTSTISTGSHFGIFLAPVNEPVHMRVIVDASVVEIFLGGGRAALTSRRYPCPGKLPNINVLNSGNEPVKLINLTAFSLRKPQN